MSSMTKDERWLLEEKYGGVATPEFEKDRGRLAVGEPLAYVIGHQPFLGLKIYLDSHPLIPRPETEWWVEKMFARIKNLNLVNLNFLDLCAGSGAIGCAALTFAPHAEVYFGEIDPHHEATIRKNISKNNLDVTRAHVSMGDLFMPFGDMKFDIIASNPPYIPENRKLPESVENWEPEVALRAGKDGLQIIRKIAKELPRRLTREGQAWIECDSAHAAAACALFTAEGFTATLVNDQYQNPRILVVHW